MPVKKKSQKKPARKAKQLSYTETKALCEEYFEHEKNVGELEGNYRRYEFVDGFITFTYSKYKNDSDRISAEALRYRMKEIKNAVGENVMEACREYKLLESRVKVLEENLKLPKSSFVERLQEVFSVSHKKEKCCICGDDC